MKIPFASRVTIFLLCLGLILPSSAFALRVRGADSPNIQAEVRAGLEEDYQIAIDHFIAAMRVINSEWEKSNQFDQILANVDAREELQVEGRYRDNADLLAQLFIFVRDLRRMSVLLQKGIRDDPELHDVLKDVLSKSDVVGDTISRAVIFGRGAQNHSKVSEYEGFDLRYDQEKELKAHIDAAREALSLTVASLKPVPFKIQREHVKRKISAAVRWLEGGDLELRMAALNQLYKIAPSAEEAVPYLINILNNERDSTQPFEAALAVVAEMGPIAKTAIPVLIDIMNNKIPAESWVRRAEAVKALGKIGPDSKAALGDLVRIANDPKEELALRRRAAEALIQIDTHFAAGLEERDTLLSAVSEADKDVVWASRLFQSDWQSDIRSVQAQP